MAIETPGGKRNLNMNINAQQAILQAYISKQFYSVTFCHPASVVYNWRRCGSIQAISIAPTTNLTLYYGYQNKNVIVKYITQHFTST